MVRKISFLFSTLAVLASPCALSAPAQLRTIEDIVRATPDLANEDRTFDITGIVHSRTRHLDDTTSYLIHDGSHRLMVYEINGRNRSSDSGETIILMDRIRLRGRLMTFHGALYPKYETVELMAHGNPNALPMLTPAELCQGKSVGKLIRMKGLIRVASQDDSDAYLLHMTVQDGNGAAPVFVNNRTRKTIPPLRYIGAEAMIYGIPRLANGSIRQHAGYILFVADIDDVTILTPPATAESAPDIEALTNALPRQIAARGLHRADGTVLAVWKEGTFLMKTTHGTIVRVILHDMMSPPVGAGIRVVGLPNTDIYNINLKDAIWQRKADLFLPKDTPTPMTVAKLLTNDKGAPQLMVKYHGKALTFSGFVRYLSKSAIDRAQLQMEADDGGLIPIDMSAHPETLDTLALGDRISATGICVINAENWLNDIEDRMPFFLVPRSPDDIVILSHAPWWTPRRLLTLLGILAAALLGVVGWNVSLNRRAKAKGKELAAEQLAHVTSELKVNERTRLAVELHDALSQTLTGVSMQIDTAAGFAKEKMPAVTKCLGIASRTIDACRMELRNTLWDLRSAALDEPSMDAAIRKTLCQNLAGIDLTVRFNVPRETFSDNTAHAVLRIIRELAANALRHGKATSLKIAGTIDNGNLLFSVRDNGCGFDPDLAPGIAQGHFGLQGIAERLERLNGEMEIDSTPGKGTKVSVTLPIPHSGE